MKRITLKHLFLAELMVGEISTASCYPKKGKAGGDNTKINKKIAYSIFIVIIAAITIGQMTNSLINGILAGIVGLVFIYDAFINPDRWKDEPL